MSANPSCRPSGPTYEAEDVRLLFEKMATTYGVVNLIASFGAVWWWRRECIRLAEIATGDRVIDLMTGGGELLPAAARRTGPQGTVVGIDFSSEMCRRAAKHSDIRQSTRIVHADVFDDTEPAEGADVVLCSFGLKTLSDDQLARLAAIVSRVLRPGGRFAFVEVTLPSQWPLLWPYVIYLRYVVPFIGRICLGDPACYRCLSRYTEAFRNASRARAAFAVAGLTVERRQIWFGCAESLSGQKPAICCGHAHEKGPRRCDAPGLQKACEVRRQS